ncbi:MAG: FeoA family protein [Caldicoprobacter sp.]|jgi:Fe2+ transport system protein A|uniref:FeoA family protein n=1 Tax=Caldicoprobacter sp. TaxID=2004500 RepID=UPI001E04F066|nr:ferrous iron transport protein A [Clostridia bacterium]
MELMPLNLLPIGYASKVKQINAQGALRRRLMDLGLILGTEIKAIRKSLSGDPTLYEIRGAMIALRCEEASQILVERLAL